MIRLLFAAALLLAVPAMAEARAPDLRPQQSKGLTGLLALVEARETAGKAMPRLADADAGPLFRQATDRRVLDGLGGADLGQWLDVCEAGTKISAAYMLHGLKGLGVTNATPAQEAAVLINGLQQRNVMTYQDEISVSLGFTVVCFAHALPVGAAFWETLPEADRTDVRREGVAKMKNGIVGMYLGAIQSLSDVGFRDANRAILLDAAVEAAPDMAGALAPADRQRVIAAVDTARSKAAPAYHARLAVIRAAMQTPACEGLCKV